MKLDCMNCGDCAVGSQQSWTKNCSQIGQVHFVGPDTGHFVEMRPESVERALIFARETEERLFYLDTFFVF